VTKLLTTLAIAFVIVAIGLLAMGIGYFFNRKKILTKGCGINPDKQKDEKCSTTTTCGLCGKTEEKKNNHIKKTDEDESQ
jgi:hypothetical protein